MTLAVIGCGGRGTHDAGIFLKDPDVRLTPVCNLFDDRLAAFRKNLKLDEAS